ncbi:MAPEG family protein [Vibrio lamellibrachiae]|uniref:MAPEG family protein n=1 Tax=Vibrio lamellibrachiae TaxID=2910253 RepID=UPI003D0F4096
MALMVLLTFIVGLTALKTRFGNVKNGVVNARYFRLMEGYEVPASITKSTRNFNNQFEIPILFYVAGTLYISLGFESMLALFLAWLFVLLRYIHSYVHLTYNKIVHRMISFWLSFLCVIGLWIELLLQNA